jgi:O-antigen/teichoic acid export membrane protein
VRQSDDRSTGNRRGGPTHELDGVGRTIVVLFSGRIAAAAATLLVNVVLARGLAPPEFGVIALAYSLSAICAIAGTLGVGLAALREIPPALARRQAIRVGRLVRAGLHTAALTSTGTTVIVGSILVAWMDLPTVAVIGVGCWCGAAALQGVLFNLYRAMHMDAAASQVSGGWVAVFSLVVAFALWMAGELTLKSAIICISTAHVLVAASAYMHLRSRLRIKQGSFGITSHYASKLLQPGIQMMLSALFLGSAAQMCVFVMAISSSLVETALFGLAIRIVSIIFLPFQILDGALYPNIATEIARGKMKELNQFLSGVSTIAIALILVLLLPFWVFGDHIVGMLFGPNYAEVGQIVLILAVGRMALVVGGIGHSVLTASGKEDVVLLTSMLCTIGAVMLSYIVASRYGACGVAIALSTVLLSRSAILSYFAKSHTSMLPIPTLSRGVIMKSCQLLFRSR